ncbi:MAG TPA: hypothetical protein VM925_37610 [Labilithrix sp.]|nr:hypothetical protein [Labilithrix sp.]
METRTLSARPDVTLAATTSRVTPTPPRASRFGEVLSSTVVRSAESAVRVLPGSPMMALAVRGGAGSSGALGVPMNGTSSAQGPTPIGGMGSPLAPPSVASASALTGPTSATGATTGPTQEASSVETSLQQSQDMNFYYLRIQETINAQNRSFTALSNVMKAEHDTVKTAIGNIR